MANWGKARVKVEPAKMKYVQGKIEGFADKALGPYFFQFMQKMMPEAVDVMRHYLEAKPNWTPTGEARKARGGDGPGRVDSGDMQRAISWRQVPTGIKGYYRFQLGWVNGEPGYSIFQEQGTKNGVKGMNSIAYTTDWLEREAALMGRGNSAIRSRVSRWRG